MAIYKDVPRFDGSGITEYYRVTTGDVVRLSTDYDSLADKPMINGVMLEGDLSTADLNIPLGDLETLETEIKDNIVNAINELHLDAENFEQLITDKVNAIISFTIVWVEELPDKKNAKPNTVYLVPKKSMIEEDNYCEEFIFTDGRWEKIGDTKVDLSGYYTKTQVDEITNELTEQVDTILEDYATKQELEDRADALEEQVDTILEDYATEDYVKSLGVFEPITPPPAGEIYCINDGEMKKDTFYELPRGVLLGYRDANGNAIQFGGTVNTTYLNTYRAVAFNNVNRNYQYQTYGALIGPTTGNPSWVHNPGLGITKTGATSFTNCGRFGTISNGYLTTSNVTTSLPTSYSTFDTQVLSGNVGYTIYSKLNTLEKGIQRIDDLHETLNSPAYHNIFYNTDDLIPDPETYVDFEGQGTSTTYVYDESTKRWTWTPSSNNITATLTITVDKNYDVLPMIFTGCRYSSSYPMTVKVNDQEKFASKTTGGQENRILLEDLIAGDTITVQYKAYRNTVTYTSQVYFEQGYSLMIKDYHTQTKEQIAQSYPLYQEGRDIFQYASYDDNMNYKDTLVFENWKPTKYLEPITFTIENKSTAFGFELDEADGYYKSNSTQEKKNYAVCKVSFNLPEPSDIKISYKSSGGYYQYGIFSNIDKTLTLSSSADSTANVFLSCYGRGMAEFDTLVYPNVPAGEHYIYIKFVQTNSTVSISNENRLYFKMMQDSTLVSEKTDTCIGEHAVVYTYPTDALINYKLEYDYLYDAALVRDLTIEQLDISTHSYVIRAKDHATLKKMIVKPVQQWYRDYINGRFAPMVVTTQVRDASWKYRDFILTTFVAHPDASYKYLYFEAREGDNVFWTWNIRLSVSNDEVTDISFNMDNSYIETEKHTKVTSGNISSYLSSYATKTYVTEQLANITSFSVEVVAQLPTENISTSTIYLVPSEKAEDNNTRDEYIYAGDSWEMIGTTKVDLSNYYTKPEVDEKVDNLFLRCNREDYEAMTQEARDSFLIAIVDDIATLDETDLTNIVTVLGDGTSTDMEIDISENEAIAITDEIIGGTE